MKIRISKRNVDNATALSNKAAASSFVPNSSAKEVMLRKLEHAAVRSIVFKVFMAFPFPH